METAKRLHLPAKIRRGTARRFRYLMGMSVLVVLWEDRVIFGGRVIT